MTQPFGHKPDITAQTETTGAVTPLTLGKGVLLPAPGTYYFAIPNVAEQPFLGIGFHFGAAFAGTITYEVCNFEQSLNGNNINDYEPSATGNWIPYNPPASASAYADKVGSLVWTGFSGVVTAGGVGGGFVNFTNVPAERMRQKVVCTVADFFRVNAHGKA